MVAYASFGTFLRPNWSIIPLTVEKMLEHQQIVVFERKCRDFDFLRMFKDSLHCALNN